MSDELISVVRASLDASTIRDGRVARDDWFADRDQALQAFWTG